MQTLDSNYWNKRYVENQTGWDLGSISTPLKEYFLQLTNKNISILIPGCGNAHEAEWLMQNGFNNVTLIDIAEAPVSNLKSKFKSEIESGKMKVLLQDFFQLNQQFDLIIEQTFFCAIDRNLRSDYVSQMHQMLNHKGKLAGILFASEFEKQGPPFGGNEDEYQTLFSKHFTDFKISNCYNSIPPRMGNELFFIATKN